MPMSLHWLCPTPRVSGGGQKTVSRLWTKGLPNGNTYCDSVLSTNSTLLSQYFSVGKGSLRPCGGGESFPWTLVGRALDISLLLTVLVLGLSDIVIGIFFFLIQKRNEPTWATFYSQAVG